MIKVTDKYGIEVDERNYIVGKICTNKEGEVYLTDKTYHDKITSAISKIAKRTAKEELSCGDYSLDEAVMKIARVYDRFSDMVEELENMLVIRDLIPEPAKEENYERVD
jgi:hypothetical protein